MGLDANSPAQRCSVGEFADLIGVSVRTLQRWDRDGKLKAGRLPSGRRYYTAEHYIACGGDPGTFAEALRDPVLKYRGRGRGES